MISILHRGLLLAGFLALAACHSTPAAFDSIDNAIANPHRSADFVARDHARNPAGTLRFFDVKPDMTVVEIWPGAGWYSEILAPMLRGNGRLYAAHFSADSNVPYFQRSLAAYQAKLAAKPSLYDQVILTELAPPASVNIAPAGSADRVLTFRNVHNWAKAGQAEAVFAAFYQALKPGGILGVVEHRAPAERSFEDQITSGYMTEAYVIGLAEQAGFRLVERSELNANPRDTAEHPAGVWTLPPTLRLGDTDRARYLAIGESDRMTLKFVRPE